MIEDYNVFFHITQSITKLKNTLIDFANSSTNHIKKRASLLSYWIDTYSDYIKNEDSFNPQSLLRYKQRNIVQINFGYRVGRELGGLHYAVIIDNNNSKKSDLVTVVPLMSLKPNFSESHNKIKLDYGVYDLVISKYNEKLLNYGNQLEQLLYDKGKNPDNTNIDCKIIECKHKIETLNFKLKQTEHIKEGTIVDVGQLITVSKQRILNPKKTSDLLYDISVEKSDFERILEKIKLNFLK